ncbi:MAG TPA: gliding motility-associated C-terminal domain-containing protein [Hanamia sp.]
MKTAYFFVFFTICLHLISFSQNNGEAQWQKYIREVQLKASQYKTFNIPSRHIKNIPPPGDRLSVAQLLTPDSIKNYINRETGKISKAQILNVQPIKRTQGNNLCIDTSFIRLLGIYNSWIFVEKVVPLADGSVLIPALIYDTSNLPNFTWHSYALLLKIDEMGNLVWIKQFDTTSPITFSLFAMYDAFELSNKDIICVAGIDTTSGLSSSNTIIYHLTKDGNIIWQTGLHSTITDFLPGNFHIIISNATEGLNGDLILCGTSNTSNSSGNFETIIRLNSAGNIVWDANYGNDGSYKFGAEGISVYIQNGQIAEVGISHGAGYPTTSAAINFLTLDYNTGNLIAKRFFRPDYIDKNEEFYKNFTYYENHCTRLSNGHYIISGKLISDFLSTTPVIDHFGIIEFDASFNLVNAYTISSALHASDGSNQLFIDKSGKGLISLFEYKGSSDASLYFGTFENQQFQNQRKADYFNISLPGYNGFSYTKDNGFIFAQSYFEGGTKSSIEFRKMHNSDTSSLCLGKDTFFMQFLPLHIIEDPGYYYLDTNINNKVQSVHYNLTQNDTLKVSSIDPCKQVNYCDTVKIHGNPFICGSQLSVLFTAYKNPSCGGIVQWNIDSTGIDSLEVQDDSSVMIHFKNVNWQGKLYATLPTDKCYITAADSITVNIIRLQTSINLGSDTVLCKGNSMILHAGSSFSVYAWQDGSTDPVLTITNPGKYYVSASDPCGYHFSDTIIVAAANFPFSIGADTLRCNSDTVHLSATPGFVNYQWQPSYNISADTGLTISVLPMTDTFYIATAQKWPGCIVSDTVNIKVFTSPSIHLGNDTSLCIGQSLTLNAGAGFNSYVWSNGAATQQVTVNQKETYFVKATAANSCTSFDTLQIINIAPLPVFTLGSDTTLCRDTVYTYHFNLPNATYLWNDGSTANLYSINQPGMYSLAVTQLGCTATDTVIIGYKNNPVAYLGNDTTICTGTTYTLDATYANAIYLWQDGSSLPDLLVNKAGVYNVAVNLNGCIAKDTVQINYLDKPQFTLGRDTSICQGQTILLQPHLNVPANFLWQDGSTQPNYAAKDTGLFSLKASNICGSYFDAVFINHGVCSLVLPNAFTPNRDGLNDVFRVKYPYPVKEFRLSIFNRFGEKIFETTDMNKGWDGTSKGNDQPVGVYVWVVQLIGNDNIVQSSKGLVTLIK